MNKDTEKETYGKEGKTDKSSFWFSWWKVFEWAGIDILPIDNAASLFTHNRDSDIDGALMDSDVDGMPLSEDIDGAPSE